MYTVFILLTYLCVIKADYECVCNYNVEQSVLPQPSAQAQPIGYLYEFDCKPSFPVADLDTQSWHPIAFEGQVAYIQAHPNIQDTICAGEVPTEDLVTTRRTTERPTHVSTTNQILTSASITGLPSSGKQDSPQTTPLELQTTPIVVSSSSSLTGPDGVSSGFSSGNSSGYTSLPSALNISSSNFSIFSSTYSYLWGNNSQTTSNFYTSDQRTSPKKTEITGTSNGMLITTMPSSNVVNVTTMSYLGITTALSNTVTNESTTYPASNITSSLLTTNERTTYPASNITSYLQTTNERTTYPALNVASSLPTTNETSTIPMPYHTPFSTGFNLTTSFQGSPSTSSIPATNQNSSLSSLTPNYTSSAVASNVTRPFQWSLLTSTDRPANSTSSGTVSSVTLLQSTSSPNGSLTSNEPWYTSITNTTRDTATVHLPYFLATTQPQKVPTTYPVPSKTSTPLTTKLTSTPTTSTTKTTTTTTTTTTTPRPTTPEFIGEISLCPPILLTYTREDEGALTQYGNHCYELVLTKLIWRKAELDCRAKGGHLIGIHTRSFQEYIYNWVTRTVTVPAIWLGLSDLEQEGRFKWITGERLATSFWYRAPMSSPVDNKLDCVQMVFGAPMFGKWRTTDCGQTTSTGEFGSQNAFICQFPIGASLQNGQFVGR